MRYKQENQQERERKQSTTRLELQQRQREIVKKGADLLLQEPQRKLPTVSLATRSQLHINPEPLPYKPVTKAQIRPTELELKAKELEQYRQIQQQKGTYAEMVRHMYKPKVSNQKQRELE